MGLKENKEKDKVARENLGKYFYDLSKTICGSGVLGAFIPFFTKEEPTTKTICLFLICVVATGGFAIMGNKILKK